MGADASIFQLLNQQKPQPGPLDNYAQMMSVKQLMGGNELQDLQRTKLTRDLQEEDATKQLFANMGEGMTAADMYKKLLGISPTRAMAFQKSDLETQTARTNLDKAHLEVEDKAMTAHKNALTGVNDPQSAAQWVQSGFADPTLAAIAKRHGVTLESSLQNIPTDPAKFQQWKLQNGLGIEKYTEAIKSKLTPVNLNNKTVLTETNPNAPGYNPNVDLTHGVSEAEKLVDERTRSEGKLNRGVQIRGQDLTDTRDRAIAGIGADGLPTGDIKEVAKLIADGHLPPLGAMALARPRGQQIMAEVAKLNPEYDAGQVQASFKAAKDFATGKQGNNVRSFNVALTHLDTLANAGEALKNGNMQVFNRIGNEYAAQTGQAAPTDFDSVKKIVGDEIVKAIVGTGGGVTDREEAAKTLAKANSPAQLTGVINRYKELMRGQLSGLRQQYEVSTGRKDFDKFLSENAKQEAHAPATATVPAGSKPMKIDGDAGFNALPKGAHYVGPDGVERVK